MKRQKKIGSTWHGPNRYGHRSADGRVQYAWRTEDAARTVAEDLAKAGVQVSIVDREAAPFTSHEPEEKK